MAKFKALRIFSEEGKVQARMVDLELDELDPGEVVIKTAWSSVNFKDALAATGAGKIIRRFPCVGGVDGCGTVVSSSDTRFKRAIPSFVQATTSAYRTTGATPNSCVCRPPGWYLCLEA